MKVSLHWLRQYLDFKWTVEELTHQLTMLGLEVEGVQAISGAFDGIVVAHVISREKHPNADKLSLCRVHDGSGERQIVCGATNFQAGDKVPLILPGASLPLKAGETQPFTIKVGKIRGVESHGMLCSPQELGLPDKVDGLLILRPDAVAGQSFAEYLGQAGSDVVFDLEVTPNRPDLNSVMGIARELAAVEGRVLNLPDPGNPISQGGPSLGDRLSVRIENQAVCSRYSARMICGVKIGPSPDWLRSRLEKSGIRSICNVVDVTNFVMLETGQPLHAFDARLIAKGHDGRSEITVRFAAPDEKLACLDGIERVLTSEMLVIADGQKALALAGIMGGAGTEINGQTVDVLLESAWFDPVTVRRTSKRLALRSESSYRFERGVDPGIGDYASRRAAGLIIETAGGALMEGVVEVQTATNPAAEIELRYAHADSLLGVTISHAEQQKHLTRLGLALVRQDPGLGVYRVPSWRVDLKREVDLIEEVGRLHGVERLPSTPPRGAIGFNEFDSVYDHISEARRILSSLGLNEAQGQTLIACSEARQTNPDQLVSLANPLSSDMDVLRPSLLPGLIHALRHNASRKNGQVALFETGRVFHRTKDGVRESRRVAMAITGLRRPAFWSGAERDAMVDVYDMKGLVEDFLDGFGLRGVVFASNPAPTSLYLEAALITLGGKVPLGELGQMHPIEARKYGLREVVCLAELDLDALLARRQSGKNFKPMPAFPSSRRDAAFLVPETVTHEMVCGCIRKMKLANLEALDLFDVFRGKGVPEGHKSMAYAFTYRASDRTLTDAEVNAAQEKAVEGLKRDLGAVLR